jgi:hypothetical protein
MFFLSDCRYANKDLLAGDLLFFYKVGLTNFIDHFLTENFVSAVSKSHSNSFYHVAMVTSVSADNVTIVEAVPNKSVRSITYNNVCDVKSFLSNVEVSRLDIDRDVVDSAIEIVKSQVGLAYNDIFSSNSINSKGELSFYCSQLIQYAYNEAANDFIFPSRPMSFSSDAGEILPYWISYYNNLGVDIVPEGEMGTHPGGLYESDFLVNLIG